MGTAVRHGRALDGRDRAGGALTAAVSESMARALWPGQDPLGRCVKAGADTAPCRTVVGVVADMRRSDLRGGPALQLYLPVSQGPERNAGNGVVARVRGDPAAVVEAVRRALQPLTPGGGYVHVRPLQTLVDPEIRPWRLGATMFGAFGALALVISAIGLYSVIAYTVAQRTHELGVRIALGARTHDVLGLVVLEGVRVAAVGVALGLAAAVAAGRFVAPLLFDVAPTDAGVLAGVAAALLVVATLASLVPALRAARVDPSVALRVE